MVQGCRREARQSPCIQAQHSNAHAERRRRSAGDSEAARHASIVTTEIYTAVAIQKVKTVHANTHPRA